MKLKLALLAATGALAVTSAAQAQDDEGYYGQIGAGIALSSDDSDFEDEGGALPASFDADLELEDNITVYGALGKYFDNGLRGELELATRTQNVESIPGDGLGFGGFPAGEADLGDLSATTLMVNVFKDFNVDAAGRLTPYLGVGIGAARIRPEISNISYIDAADPTNPAAAGAGYRVVAADQEYVPAYQGMAGLSFDFTDNMMIDVRYKYLATNEFNYGSYVNNLFTELSGEYQVQEITAGLRWNFGGGAEPAPAPVAAPAPAPQPQYKTCFDGSRVLVSQPCPVVEEEVEVPEELELTVYFDFDRANLTDAAQSLIAARAAEAREYEIENIVVSGNTDTAGSAAYNQRLSARRAEVVREALISNGIDSSVITIEALGESNPARPTGDGVREPLNRRTEVEFSF